MNLNPFIFLIINIIDLYSYFLMGLIVISWLIYFNIVNYHQTLVFKKVAAKILRGADKTVQTLLFLAECLCLI